MKSEHHHVGHYFISAYLQTVPLDHVGNTSDNAEVSEGAEWGQGGREEHHFPTQSENSGPIPDKLLAWRKEGKGHSVLAPLSLLDDMQPAVAVRFDSLWAAFQVERRKGVSEATPRPSFQTIKEQRLPWKAPHQRAVWNLSCPCK